MKVMLGILSTLYINEINVIYFTRKVVFKKLCWNQRNVSRYNDRVLE